MVLVYVNSELVVPPIHTVEVYLIFSVYIDDWEVFELMIIRYRLIIGMVIYLTVNCV